MTQKEIDEINEADKIVDKVEKKDGCKKCCMFCWDAGASNTGEIKKSQSHRN